MMKKPKAVEAFQNFLATRTDAEKAYTMGLTLLGLGILGAKIGETFDRYEYEDESVDMIDITDSASVEECE